MDMISIIAAIFVQQGIPVSYDGENLEAQKNGMCFGVVELTGSVALLWHPVGSQQNRGYRTFDVEGPSDVEDVIEEIEAKSSFDEDLPPVKVVDTWYYDDPVSYCLKRADLVDPENVVEEPYGVQDGRDLPDAYAVVKDVYRVERDRHTTPVKTETRKWKIRELLRLRYDLDGLELEEAVENAYEETEDGLSVSEAVQRRGEEDALMEDHHDAVQSGDVEVF
jgi:hypothetical protein